MTKMQPGEFEQAVLLSILREGSNAFALEVRAGLEGDSGKPVSRGAFYATVERLKRKGMLSWETVRSPDTRRETNQRLFSLTTAGIKALREAKKSLDLRSARLAEVLGDS